MVIYIKKNWANNLILAFLLLYATTPFYFTAIESLNKLLFYAYGLIPSAIAFLDNFRKWERQDWMLVLQIIAVLVVTLFIGLTIGNGSNDYFLYMLRYVLSIFAVISTYRIWRNNYFLGKVDISFEELYLVSVVEYVLFSIIMILIPGFKNFWLSIISNEAGAEFITRTEYVTRVGINGFANFTIAFKMTTAFISLMFLMTQNKLRPRKISFYLIIILLGGIFYGRVGLTSIIVCAAIYIIYGIFRSDMRLLKRLIPLLLIILASIIILYPTNESIQNAVNWAFEPIINYFSGNGFTSASTNDLSYAYKNFTPPSSVLWHGVGKWYNESGGYIGGFDIGFMRNIFFGGVVYTIFLYMTVVIFVISIRKKMIDNNLQGTSIICFLIFLSFLLFELKGDITFDFIRSILPLYLGTSFYYEMNLIE